MAELDLNRLHTIGRKNTETPGNPGQTTQSTSNQEGPAARQPAYDPSMFWVGYQGPIEIGSHLNEFRSV